MNGGRGAIFLCPAALRMPACRLAFNSAEPHSQSQQFCCLRIRTSRPLIGIADIRRIHHRVESNLTAVIRPARRA